MRLRMGAQFPQQTFAGERQTHFITPLVVRRVMTLNEVARDEIFERRR